MKKFIFLLLSFFTFFLLSCKQSQNCSESFANIIKDDSSRVNELLRVADSINHYNENKGATNTADDDVIDAVEAADIRKPEPLIIDPNKLSLVKFSVAKIKRFIKNNELKEKDTLYFCLGTYKNQNSVDRYNKRNPGGNYSLKDLHGRPTLILKFTTASLAKSYFDGGTLCPPPPDCVKK